MSKMAEIESFGYEEESQMKKLKRKAADSPFAVVGLIGLTGIVAYSLYGIRQRKIPLSLYLIHTRVGAQGFAISCLTVGVGYNLFKNYLYPMIKGTPQNETSAIKEEK